jgi:hypothetical protein
MLPSPVFPQGRVRQAVPLPLPRCGVSFPWRFKRSTVNLYSIHPYTSDPKVLSFTPDDSGGVLFSSLRFRMFFLPKLDRIADNNDMN